MTPRRHQVGTRLTDIELRRLAAVAAEHGVSLAVALRAALTLADGHRRHWSAAIHADAPQLHADDAAPR